MKQSSSKEVSSEVYSDKFRVPAFVKMRDTMAGKKKKNENLSFLKYNKAPQDVMVIRYHTHLETPFYNDKISRYR